VTVEKALRLAQDADLDLVEVAPQARPPVCKLMDFGKFKYESALKAREARKKATHTVIKEMKLRPKIDPHDYETKKGHVVRFLNQGDKVKITIMFRGREQHRPELGFRLLAKLAEDVSELGWVESAPKQDGRNMIMVIGPHRRKADAKAEREADKEVARARRRADDEANAQRRRARGLAEGSNDDQEAAGSTEADPAEPPTAPSAATEFDPTEEPGSASTG
jgi:translation initiation factor IF-3